MVGTGTGIAPFRSFWLQCKIKHLHDRIISPRWEVLMPSFFIEVSVLSQESEQSCIMCVSAIDFACFYYFSIRFFSTMWYSYYLFGISILFLHMNPLLLVSDRRYNLATNIH
jgi:hypothetical protein